MRRACTPAGKTVPDSTGPRTASRAEGAIPTMALGQELRSHELVCVGFCRTASATPVLADFRQRRVRWADQMPLSAWNLLSCMLLAAIVCQMLFFGQVAAKSTAMDLAMPAGLASTRAGRRGTSGGSPDPSVPCGSYSRLSSDLQRDDSISDQQRKCHEKAATNGHAILSDCEFHDEAVSGTKRDRTGLNDMLAAAEAGKFKVLYFHSLSRLARKA